MFPASDQPASERCPPTRTEAPPCLPDLIDSLPAVVWEADAQRRQFTFVSAHAEAMLGYPVKQWYAPGFWTAHLHQNDLERVLREQAMHGASGQSETLEYRMVAADGSSVWLKDCIGAAAGGQAPLRGVMLDITHRKAAESAGFEPANFLRQLGDIIPSPIFWKDPQGRYLGCNAAFEDYIGIKRGDLLGKSVFDIAPPELAEIYAAADQALLASSGTQVYEAEVRYADGSRHNVIFYKTTFSLQDGSLGGLLGVMLDITERQQLAAALQEQNTLLQRVVDNIPCGISLIDAELNVILINRRARHILDVPDEFFQNGKAPLERIFRYNAARGEYGIGDPEALVAARLDLVRSNQPHVVERTRPDGTIIEIRGEPLADGGFVTVYLDVTKERNIEAALARETASLKAVIEQMPQGISVFDEHLRLKHWNTGMVEVLNLPPALVVQNVHFDDLIRVPAHRGEYGPGDPEAHVARIHSLAIRFEPHQFERAQPSGKTHLVSGRPMLADGRPTGFVTTYTDITARKRAEEELRLAASVFENSTEGIVITDARTRILKVNRAFCAITGFAPEEVVGKSTAQLKSGRQDAAFYRAMWHALEERGHWSGEIWNRRKSGEAYVERLAISRVNDASGAAVNYIGTFSDISHAKAAQSEIERLSYFDGMTNLPNRSLLQDRLRHALLDAQRKNRRVALVALDLDRMGHINDTLGHQVGDQIIIAAAVRLVATVREVDTVSRNIGDVFAVILEDLQDSQAAAHMAERLLAAIREPFQLDEHEVAITACIGISIFPDDGREPMLLLKNADVALRHAKDNGIGNFQFFREEMNTAAMERMLIENSLRLALRRDEFRVYYQPQLELGSNQVLGMEALVRWAHPELGLVAPAKFIHIAEETGQIVDIGMWVLREACRETRCWHEQGYPDLRVAVNVSAKQFSQENFASEVKRVLRETGLAPDRLELELTESLIMQRPERVIRIMEELRAAGVKFSIDDFGTGYSSLSQLKLFPIDKLKIDQSFIRDIDADANGAAITRAIIALGSNMHLTVVAEGVETPAQQRFLIENGCHGTQGYLFSRPLPAAEFSGFLERHAQAR